MGAVKVLVGVGGERGVSRTEVVKMGEVGVPRIARWVCSDW